MIWNLGIEFGINGIQELELFSNISHLFVVCYTKN